MRHITKNSQSFALVHRKCIAWLCPHSKVEGLASLVTSSRAFDVAYPSSCLIGLALEMKRTNQMMYYAWRSQTQHWVSLY